MAWINILPKIVKKNGKVCEAKKVEESQMAKVRSEYIPSPPHPTPLFLGGGEGWGAICLLYMAGGGRGGNNCVCVWGGAIICVYVCVGGSNCVCGGGGE